ncbi:MAG: dTMP kinase [Calditrichaeota bacterium]|nr:MAG: dTMP kinase [Calditrichota bacterium]
MKNYKNFISFEGIDFSGKTTQIKLLMDRLHAHQIEPLLVREPGGTVISEKIRDILLSTDHPEMHEKTEMLLYEAARSQLVHEKILPFLEQNRYVIADRFYDSTTAYQGYGRMLNLQMIMTINQFATSFLKPYRTFYIDIPPELATGRRKRRHSHEDRLERSGLDFFTRIREGFLELCREESDRFILIDGDRNPDIIAQEIWEIVTDIWSIKSRQSDLPK